MFRYRQATTVADLALHAAYAAAPRLRVLVTGASGLVGRAVVGALTTGGHTVVAVVRGEGPVRWSVEAGLLDDPGPVDAVVHLAGESLAQRWTPARKAEMRRSRVDGTRALVASLRAFGRRPAVFLSASAVGWYDDLGDVPQDEDAPRAPAGFRADLVADWEAEAAQADADRVVHLRLGVVVSPRGGMLQRVLPVFRLGLGGPVGSGRQYVPWIGLDDVVALVVRILQEPGWQGPVNAVAPEAVTSRAFARTLGRVLRRPAVLPAPAFALRLAFGEMADALLLAGARVVPARALAMGHGFRHPRLEDALRHGLGR
ncbi:MAG: TIGR01777 family oxidoreductase [bacterium]